MNILIVGLGYAGKRYQRTFEFLSKKHPEIDISLAYVSRKCKKNHLIYFKNISDALIHFSPEIIIISTNDDNHFEVIKELSHYQGFIICEKPLITANDNLEDTCYALENCHGFALDLVERYSKTTQTLKNLVKENNWSLIRASFYWGKNRINDYRPTCGVISEIIHALDLVEWIYPQEGELEIASSLVTCSDFSISGEEVIDTAMLTANMGKAVIVGYSSFVNIVRQRTVDFSFFDIKNKLIHARIIFDTPHWDNDHLQVWTQNNVGKKEILYDVKVTPDDYPNELETIGKLSILCDQVTQFVINGKIPPQPFVNINTAKKLQKKLNEIHLHSVKNVSANYIRGKERIIQSEYSDFESLG
ncbi:Gfo/Idh/MocA family oxidoreductase [Xenorhabdus littoralis]|uniref:Gfo/Idh/MocA family oxidoreductase n=1 Tax=Xenorhabdus littoralis TaxID=2582835 RepID=UPI0029E7E3C5|nr:Gfo/Idh/MocA family oxidoreductase [Xenorhabdus sp. psl]MDX7991053.1 oxidoreductase [Xenorhabdus sp. psl]